ncbi:DNA-binding transcriptional LysR family regulator [Agromyces sp. 3263]|uniref:LysR family transcriptional regulator n=1 Tax=Agromyces sp. 3263 TaxID=2817750 RepID=UPI00285B4A0A|nr:LysR family transcriptional regulator [Agromyces sp. 3263]MDR6905855.1 DNA-binding transcriptional LysR family regulator [Agromyces sp. 3263]
MELREIEIFLTLADELHFGRTAERLHVSVSRVSHAIRVQETAIGAPLFTRTSRRVELTQVGEVLLEGLRPAFDGIQHSVAAATALARQSVGTVTIGAMGAQVHDLAPVLDTFRASHPFAEVRFREVFFTDPFDLLRRGEVDLVTAWLPVDEPDLAVACVLREEPLNLIVSSRGPLAGRSSVDLEELADFAVPAIAGSADWLSGVVPFSTPSGRPIPRAGQVSTYPELLALVASGHVVCPVPDEGRRYFPWPGVEYIPFGDAAPVRWALIRRRGRTAPIVRAFTDAAQATGASADTV